MCQLFEYFVLFGEPEIITLATALVFSCLQGTLAGPHHTVLVE